MDTFMLTEIDTNLNEIAIDKIDKVFSRKKAAPKAKPGMTKNAVINAFKGLHFNHAQWHMYLAKPPEWLKACQVEKGAKSATWNPILIGLALLTKGVYGHKLDDVFGNLKDWAEEWKAVSA
jgi:hypothetical protein